MPHPESRLGIALAAVLALAACKKAENVPPPPPKASAEAPAAAPTTPPPPGAVPNVMTGGPVAGADRAFIADAATSGLAEVEAARLVENRSTNDGVKNFAQTLERDHTGANDELKRIAGQKGVDVPSSVTGDTGAQLSRLNGLAGADLDKAFLQQFGIDAHQKAISLFERQAREGQDADLKSFAERTLPKLREHLAMAQQLQGGKPAG